MISIPYIQLNVCREYIRRVKDTFPTDSGSAYYAQQFLFILQIREWQLKRELLNRPGTMDDLATLKTGQREAEHLNFAISVGSRKDVIAEIETILQLVALEFHAEITHIEEQHPELRAEFAYEREEHRLMWNDYVRAEMESRES